MTHDLENTPPESNIFFFETGTNRTLRVERSWLLAGEKCAVKAGGTVYVSPAMWELLWHEEGEDLRRVLASIEVLNLDRTLDPCAFCAGGTFTVSLD